MQKNELTRALSGYLHAGDFQTRGEKHLVFFLRWYLDERVADETTFKHCGISHYLPRILADAWELFRHDDHSVVAKCRQDYLEAIERGNDEVVDLLDVQFQAVEKALTISTLARLIESAIERDMEYRSMGANVRHNIESYFFAETTVLSKAWDCFLRQVYENGLLKVIDASDKCGMSGQFGNVAMRSLVSAGRIVFTLVKVEGAREGLEESITFIGEDGDKKGYRFGIQSVHCDFLTAMSLIDEVIRNWPSSPEAQSKIFTDNANVSIA
ncbi:hypothetical protein HOB10_04260 [Candidatus Parcubacteria bacterium]|nr:hypothetical protein [Candidatus Parcubacteria bacterium]